MATIELTQELLREYFTYDGINGTLLKIKKVCKNDKLGHVKLFFRGKYLKFNFMRSGVSLHRAIFLYHYGYLPKEVDHIDLNKTNNKIENLRPATKSENATNRRSQVNKTSKYKGVSWAKSVNKWVVFIDITRYVPANGKRHNKNLGYFNSERAAALRYLQESQKYHGSFLNVGINGNDSGLIR